MTNFSDDNKRTLAEASHTADESVMAEELDARACAESFLNHPSDTLDAFDHSVTMLQSKLIVDNAIYSDPMWMHLRNLETLYRELEAENDKLKSLCRKAAKTLDESAARVFVMGIGGGYQHTSGVQEMIDELRDAS